MGLATFLNERGPTRGLLWLGLSDEAVIETRHIAGDAGGGGTITWAAAGTVPCRIAPLTKRPQEKMTGGQIDERSTHILTSLPGSTIGLSDRVVISNHGTFEITGAHQRTSALSSVYEVIQIL